MSAPEIRKLAQVITMEDAKLNIRKVSIGKPDKYHWLFPPPEKILMLLGETGTGKSTLINGLVNYIMGVNYEDKYRYKLVDDKTERSQAHSQTTWITAYTFPKQSDFRLPYTFTIIDTPGYGDTEGLERDKKITKQIKEFFSIKGPEGIDHLNGIGFVVKASDCRLTVTQKYIFNSILSMFGKDFSKNIFMMITFADGGDPQVLDAIAEANLTFEESFQFNNSALFAKIGSKKKTFTSMYWEMGVSSFQDFFKTFNGAESVSLNWTKEILAEREHLECVIQGLQQNIQTGLYKADELHQKKKVVQEHEKDLQSNRDFTYKIKVTKQRKINLSIDEHVTNCLRCHTTCHHPCYIPKDEDKAHCAAMGKTGYCGKCPGNCYWDDHINNAYRLEEYREEETRTSEDLKRSFYDEARRKKTAAENVTEGLKQGLNNLYLNVFSTVQQVNEILHRLEEIALRPNPLSDIQYIELLIEAEKSEGKPGFQDRVKDLEVVRVKADMLSKITDKEKKEQMLKDAAAYCWHKLK